jgi:hypothetical protein
VELRGIGVERKHCCITGLTFIYNCFSLIVFFRPKPADFVFIKIFVCVAHRGWKLLNTNLESTKTRRLILQLCGYLGTYGTCQYIPIFSMLTVAESCRLGILLVASLPIQSLNSCVPSLYKQRSREFVHKCLQGINVSWCHSEGDILKCWNEKKKEGGGKLKGKFKFSW